MSGPAIPEGAGLAARRDELMQAFAQWIDEMADGAAAPDGPGAELLAQLLGTPDDPAEADRSVDRYSMWSAVVALTQEVKLQGRAFGRLAETLEPLARLPEAAEAQTAAFDNLCARLHDERQREMADILIDVCDRMERAVAAAAEPLSSVARADDRPGLLERLAGGRGHAAFQRAAATLESLASGQRLILDRLRDSMCRIGMEETACAGEPFDPECMRAVESVADPALPDGTVAAVIRRGYRMEGEVLRLAEVRVSRKQLNVPAPGDS